MGEPMGRPRIAIAGFQHETNTFAPSPASYADFEAADAWPGLVRGADLLDSFDGLNLPIAGFLERPSRLHEAAAKARAMGMADAAGRLCGLIEERMPAAGRAGTARLHTILGEIAA